MQCKTILRRPSALTKCAVLTLMLLVSGCVTASPPAICSGTAAATDAHAQALLDPATPDAVVVTGDTLIAQLDAGCDR